MGKTPEPIRCQTLNREESLMRMKPWFFSLAIYEELGKKERVIGNFGLQQFCIHSYRLSFHSTGTIVFELYMIYYEFYLGKP